MRSSVASYVQFLRTIDEYYETSDRVAVTDGPTQDGTLRAYFASAGSRGPVFTTILNSNVCKLER